MLENLSWEQITAWAMMIGGPVLSFAGAMLVTKLRKKAAEMMARDQQIDAQSVEIIALANKVEIMSQIVSIAFLESKGITPETKLQLANLAKSIASKSKTTAGNLIDTIMLNAQEQVKQAKETALSKVQEKAAELINNIKSEIANVDELI
jgi:putative Mn2+ efflux pump MntP